MMSFKKVLSLTRYSSVICPNYASSIRRCIATQSPVKRSFLKKSLYALTGVAGVATIAVAANYMKYGKINAESEEVPPDIIPSKKVRYPAGLDTNGLHFTLFQYQTCPFCCKVRAFLDYYGISYDVVEVNPVLRQQIKFSNTKKVPILIIKDNSGPHQLKDSSVIISALYSFFLDTTQDLTEIADSFPKVSFVDENGKECKDVFNRYFIMFRDSALTRSKDDLKKEREWREWADAVLVHVLSPNVYREPGEAVRAFQWFSEVGDWEKNFSLWERWLVVYVGAAAMYLVGKRLRKRHGLKEDVRESLYDACKTWLKEIGKEQPFHGGKHPNLADLAVFGVLNAIEGCEAFQDAQQNTGIGVWYNRMKSEVAHHNGIVV